MAREYIPIEVEWRVALAARHRCDYCLRPRHLVMARLEIEYVIPLARGGAGAESNLWLSCPLCNRAKGDRIDAADPETGVVVPLFHPRRDRWADHFRWTDGGLRIAGRTPAGRATVAALHLDSDPDAITVRSYWALAGWHPPDD